jgi:electron transport complex protein RnfA
MKDYLTLALALVLVQNFVFSQFLGLCPFIGVSKRREAAMGMGLAVIFVMTVSCLATFLVRAWILAPFGAEDYLDIVSFIVVIASIVQFVEIVMKKTTPALYAALGIYLPLISTNCAVLGSTQMRVTGLSARMAAGEISFADALGQNVCVGFFGGVGFALALLLMASVRERLEYAPVPECLKGVPIAFLSAAAMALAFYGFAGMV